MRKCANIQPYKRRPLVKYDFATTPFRISLYIRKIQFSFLSVQKTRQSIVVFVYRPSPVMSLWLCTCQQIIAIGWGGGDDRVSVPQWNQIPLCTPEAQCASTQGCSVAQMVVRWLAVRQARARISTRQPHCACSYKDMKKGLSECYE